MSSDVSSTTPSTTSHVGPSSSQSPAPSSYTVSNYKTTPSEKSTREEELVATSRKGKNKEKLKDLNHFARSGIAGGVAGCVAKTVVAPLDRVKILFQASNPDFQKYAGSWSGAFRAGSEIYRSSGVRGLLQGHSATLLRVFPYAAVKFVAYDQVHDFLMPTPAHETNVRRFSAGAISGAISVVFTYPLELIRVRMAFSTTPAFADGSTRRPSFLKAARQIYIEGASPNTSTSHSSTPSSFRSSTSLPSTLATSTSSPSVATSTAPVRNRLFQSFPLLKFYRGFSPSLVGMVPYAGTSFLAWGFLHSLFFPPPSDPRQPKPKPSALANLAIGAVSGAFAQTISYPFEVVRRRMQVGGLKSPERWLGWRETIVEIYQRAKVENREKSGWWRRAGWRGFYVGLGIGYLKVVPMNAVSFTVWVAMKKFLDV